MFCNLLGRCSVPLVVTVALLGFTPAPFASPLVAAEGERGNASGILETTAAGAPSIWPTFLMAPLGLDVDGAGNLVVAGPATGNFEAIMPGGLQTNPVTVPTVPRAPSGVAGAMPVAAVPDPSVASLLVVGALVCGWYRRLLTRGAARPAVERSN